MCHRRVGNNVVLVDDTGGLTCYKCFNLVLRSSNVLQIHTAALDKCYTTEEKALADCPSDMSIREKRSREIMLYRKFNPAITNKTRQNGLQNNWLLRAYIANTQEIEQHFQVFKAFPTQKTATKCVAVQNFSKSQKSRNFSKCQNWLSKSYQVPEG